jgi:hypothetical protein
MLEYVEWSEIRRIYKSVPPVENEHTVAIKKITTLLHSTSCTVVARSIHHHYFANDGKQIRHSTNRSRSFGLVGDKNKCQDSATIVVGRSGQ